MLLLQFSLALIKACLCLVLVIIKLSVSISPLKNNSFILSLNLSIPSPVLAEISNNIMKVYLNSSLFNFTF